MVEPPRDRSKIGAADVAPVQDQLPHELQRAEAHQVAARHAALDRNPCAAAIVELELLLGGLLAADERATRETREPQGAGNFVGAARLEQRAVERDVLRRRPQARIDQTPPLRHRCFPSPRARQAGTRRCQRFCMKKMNSFSAFSEDSRALPVWREKAWKSLTEPGSVASTLSTWPDAMSVSAFLVRSIGSGQLSPRASSSLSNWMAVMDGVIALSP